MCSLGFHGPLENFQLVMDTYLDIEIIDIYIYIYIYIQITNLLRNADEKEALLIEKLLQSSWLPQCFLQKVVVAIPQDE